MIKIFKETEILISGIDIELLKNICELARIGIMFKKDQIVRNTNLSKQENEAAGMGMSLELYTKTCKFMIKIFDI